MSLPPFAHKLNILPQTVECTQYIPKLLHMIWVGPDTPPPYVSAHFQTWNNLLPSWTLRLWTNDDIHSTEFPAHIVDQIHLAKKGAQKADIMRYFIIEKYGGVYMDVDVVPHRSLSPLLCLSPVVLCHDLPITWAYVAIGFFASAPHHPLFKKACELCARVTLNTPDIHLYTGPRLLGEALSLVKYEGPPITLLPTKFFYRNEAFPNRFGTHTYAKNW